MFVRAVPLHSNLQLQKLLYFNYFYSFFFGAAHIATAAYKLRWLQVQDATKFGVPVVVGLWIICEIIRLRLGYSGNLKEKVPELSAFFLLTIFPQLPFIIFLTFVQTIMGDHMPLDLAAGLLLIIFTVFELHYSYKAVKEFIRKQTADFYRICQEESLSIAAAQELARRLQSPLVTNDLLGPNGYLRVATDDRSTAPSASDIAREGARALAQSLVPRPRQNETRTHEE